MDSGKLSNIIFLIFAAVFGDFSVVFGNPSVIEGLQEFVNFFGKNDIFSLKD